MYVAYKLIVLAEINRLKNGFFREGWSEYYLKKEELRINQTLELLPSLDTRTVICHTLVQGCIAKKKTKYDKDC